MKPKSESAQWSIFALMLFLSPCLQAQVPPPNGPGNALAFDGVNDYLAAAPANLPAGNSAYTIEAWIKPDTMHVGAIVTWGNFGVPNQVNGFALTTTGLGNYWWANDIEAAMPNLAGAWHHVAATFDGSSRRLLLDGAVIGSDAPVGHNAGTANFRIGSSAWAGGIQFFDGQMDEVRVWNVARTTNQIQEAMRRQLWGSEPGLVACWRFDEGAGLSAFDATGNAANTATLVNGPTWVASSLAPFAATVATHPASPVAPSNATLNGWVDARASWTAVQCYFQWGTEPAMTNTSLPFIAPAGGLPTYWNTPVSGLTPGRKYYFRAVAVNDLGPSCGATLTFTPDLVSTFTVFTTNGNGPGSLRQAVFDANATPGRDTITFAVTGTIALSSGGLPTGSLEVTNDLTILGPGASLLTVEGGYDQVFFRIFNITNASATIAGLTLARGVSLDPQFSQPGCGGAILNYGTLLLSNCVLRSNVARGVVESGAPAFGGAVYNAGALTLVNCAFLDNAARGGEGVPSQTPDFIPGQGGLGLGGAIYNGGTLLALNSTLAGNQAEGGRGGTDVTFYDVGGDGGNAFGGGILNAGPATLVNCTLATNAVRGGAGGPGGVPGAPGVGHAGGLLVTGAVCQVLNTLIALNAANTASNVAGPVTSLGHNLIGVTNNSAGWVASDLKGSAAAPLNPMLGALRLHGGAVETWFLLDGSPALDAGDNNVTNTPYSLATDARGRPRLQRAAVDIGAFERDPGNLLLVTNTVVANVDGSFFRAIVLANTNPGPDTILFSIPGVGVKTLATNMPYPTIISPVIIDGYSQPGSRPNTRTNGNDALLRIHLIGTNAGAGVIGLRLNTSNSLIRGLTITRFSGGELRLDTNGQHVIQGNFLGLEPDGTTVGGNSAYGLRLDRSSGNQIGGRSSEARNLLGAVLLSGSHSNIIEGNYLGTTASGLLPGPFSGIDVVGGHANRIGGGAPGAGNVIGNGGLYIAGGGSRNRVQGNLLGVGADGLASLGSVIDRIYFELDAGTNNVIGTDGDGVNDTGEGNVIARYQTYGIRFTGGDFNVVAGNKIGTDATGTLALGGVGGIDLDSSDGNVIGGLLPAQRNLISGNTGYGVGVSAGVSNRILGNYIGTLANGAGALANGCDGVTLASGAQGTLVASNRIAFNSLNGVTLWSPAGTANAILGNEIHANGGLGIDLGYSGSGLGVVTPNDPGDADPGANNLQNFPVITNAVAGAVTTIQGTLNSTAHQTFRVEFFGNAAADPSGYGEGQTYLGAMNVLTDGGGNAPFTFVSSAYVPPGPFVTATTTDAAGNTSEFSPAQAVAAALVLSAQGGGTVTPQPDQAAYALGQMVTLTAAANPYFQFAGWSDGGLNPVRAVTIGATNRFTALFTPVTPLETLALKVWEVSFGGDEYDELRSVLRTSDGGYLLAGHSDTYPNGSGNRTSPSCGGLDLWVVKLDGAGREQWQRTLGAGDNYLGAAWQTPDGGYLLAGSSGSGDTLISGDCGQTATNFGYSDFWLVRLDTNGHRLWDQSFGGSDTDVLTALAPVADGGFLLGGYSSSAPGGNKTAAALGDFDYWVVRVDTNGTRLWDRSFGSPGDDRLHGLAATADGGFVLAGSSDSIAGGNKTSSGYGDLDFWVLRLDGAGNKIWEHPFGTTQRDDARAVVATADGGFAVAGDSVTIETERDYWVLRLDGAGNVVWSTFLGEDGDDGNGETAYALAATPDGGFVVTGESNTRPDGHKTSPHFGEGDFWTVRLDAAGNKTWERADGGTRMDVPSAVTASWDGGYVLGGTSMSGTDGNKTTTSGLGNIQDYWAVNVHERTAPVGTPVILVNGLYAPSGSLTSTGSTLVESTSTFTNGLIFFTLDGSDPNGGYLYTGPFYLGADATLRAVAYSADFTRSWEAEPVAVTVLTPPVILTQPQGQVVALGATVALAVGVSGSAPLAYQWFFGGSPVADATNAHLVFTALANSGGNYFVTVQNSQGAVTSTVATLTVLLPPGFLSQPVGTNVSPGATVTFSVTVSGTGPFTFQWRKNGLNIPGATGATLTLSNVTVADGGSHTVVVANQAGTASSAPAVLAVGPAPAGVSDSFAGRIALPSTTNGAAAGTNTLATKEPGEPNHAGKPGGKSVWYSWTAPASGIATFRTTGSAFDTLLAVYTGASPSNLAAVASDEDSGGSLTSQLQFNALAGTTYAIALDSFSVPAGYFVLGWTLTPSPTPLPVLLFQPASQTVPSGGEATFSVAAEGPGLSHQWVFNGIALPGATSSNYVIPSVQSANVGTYVVRVSNGAGTVESVPAVLEIGPFAELRSVDKLRDALLPGGAGGRPARLRLAAVPAISAGTIFSQMLNTTNSGSSEGEVNPCGSIGGASRWITLVPAVSGTLAIDTLGSTFDTLLAVFEATVPDDLTTIQLVACDDNGAGDGLRSRVVFPAVAGTSYYVRVDGPRGISGLVQLNWALGSAPSFVAPPAGTAPLLVRLGESFALSVATNGLPPPGVQWLRNDAPIPQGTSASLVVARVLDTDAGRYAVVLSNFIGSVTGFVAAVVVETNFVTLARNTFDAGAEGWTAVGDVGTVNFVSAGGNPGGHVSAADTPGGIVWFWRAPPRLLGNQSGAYGGLLSFDLKQSLEAAASGALAVVLSGGGVTLVFEALRSPGTNWSAYKVALVESAGWRKGSPAGPPPTRSEMLRVLASLDALLIQGKQSPQQGLGFLDNVILVAASTNQVAWLNHRRTTDGQLVLEWPPLPAGFHLEAKEDLNATLWTPLNATTDATTGLNVLTNTPGQPQRFFRLRKP